MLEDYVADTGCTETDLEVPWELTDNLVKGCVQYFVPGKHGSCSNGNLPEIICQIFNLHLVLSTNQSAIGSWS